MTLYKKKFRVESTRLTNNTYQKGVFFVTICTQKKMQWFGEVHEKGVKRSELGAAAERCWKEIPEHFPHVLLDSFVIMPDHIHGIVHMKLPDFVETQNFASLQNKFGPQSKNLGSIIRGFKIGVRKEAAKLRLGDFRWQPRFYDHVVRNERELRAIRTYIKDNPRTWDKENIPWHTDARFFGL